MDEVYHVVPGQGWMVKAMVGGDDPDDVPVIAFVIQVDEETGEAFIASTVVPCGEGSTMTDSQIERLYHPLCKPGWDV